MREYKFRGKSIDIGEWKFGDLLRLEKNFKKRLEIFHWGEKAPFSSVVIPETIGQFTGLTDKSGKDIYDGDILGADGKVIGFVEGGVRGYCYDVVYSKPLTNGERRWSLYGTVENDYKGRIEVIGNIHDNPELSNP